MKRKRAQVPRADQKQEHGLQIRIETGRLTRSGRRANTRFTRMITRTTRARRTRPPLTLSPGRPRLHAGDRCERRGCQATPFSRQVCDDLEDAKPDECKGSCFYVQVVAAKDRFLSREHPQFLTSPLPGTPCDGQTRLMCLLRLKFTLN